MSRVWALAGLCLLIAIAPARADIRSYSYSIWDVLGSTVHLRFMLPVTEVRHLAEPGAPVPTMEEVKKYVGDHVAVSVAGAACPPVDQGEEAGLINTLALSPGLYRFEVIFQCPIANDIVLQNTALFDRQSDHVNFARVQVDGSGYVQRLFTVDHERLKALPDSGLFAEGGILYYLRMGFEHVLGSFDRVAFMLGLLLLLPGLREIRLIAGGLLLGYTASLTISLTGIIAPRMDTVEALMGFMSALVAGQVIALASQRPQIVAAVVGLGLLVVAITATVLDPPARLLLCGVAVFSASYLSMCDRIADRAAFWLIPTTLFAFMDGFGLAAAVATLDVPARQLAPMVIGFDGGSMLAGLAVLIGVGAMVAVLHRKRLALPRPIVTDFGAATLAGLGVLWFVSRIYI
jgi:HupE / UreJ protein